MKTEPVTPSAHVGAAGKTKKTALKDSDPIASAPVSMTIWEKPDEREESADTARPVCCRPPKAPETQDSEAMVRLFARMYNELLRALSPGKESIPAPERHSAQGRQESEPGTARADLRRADTVHALREAIYKPVEISAAPMGVRLVSLYEIGVAHSPDHQAAGGLSVDTEKLTAALETRDADIRALFGENDGIPARLCDILYDFMKDTASQATRAACADFYEQWKVEPTHER